MLRKASLVLMRLAIFLGLISAAAACLADAPTPKSDGSVWLVFKARNGQCMPYELIEKLKTHGFTTIGENEGGKFCCPYGAQKSKFTGLNSETWNQIAPFILLDEPQTLTIDQRCMLPSMSMDNLKSVIATYQTEEAKKREIELEEDRRRGAFEADSKIEAQAKSAAAAQAEESRFIAGINALTNNDVCLYYGQVVRNQEFAELYQAPTSKIKALIASEFKKRKLVLNVARVKERALHLNDTTCHLYAAWGMPDHSNRSVNAYSVHVQHVFGSRYIYTQNDRITSWQD